MRLHRLSMVGIGPFSAPVDIDFTRLGESGLFLLEGPTGSGKSTIIDAISFALYGRVAQATSDSERLRSHHGDPSAEPVVELIFETQSGIYRVRRTPGYERPKRRGTGMSKVQGSIKIWRLNSPDGIGGGEPLSTRMAEADDEILRAVGLNHAQFVQTIVLPQGEFASFLRSKTEDKKALLQKLFGTELISWTQQKLIDERRAAEAQRTQSAAALARATEAFGVAAGDPPEETAVLIERAADGDVAAIQNRIRFRMAELLQTQHQAERAHHRASSHLADAHDAIALARDIHRRQIRRADLTRRQADLKLRLPEFELVRHRMDRADQAAVVAPVADALAAAVRRAERAQEHEAQARLELGPEQSTADEPALRRFAAQLHTTIGALAEELRREREFGLCRSELETAIRDRDELAELTADATHELRGLPELIAELGRERQEAAALAGRVPALVVEQQRAIARLHSAELAARAAVAAEQDEQITQAALAAYQAQEERLARLQLSWRAGVAGQLGQTLTSGDPCLVCGSVEHPRPATPEAHDVSQADLESAESTFQRLRRNVESARTQLLNQRAELAELRYAADQLSPEQAQAKVEELNFERQRAEAAGVACQGLDERLDQVRSRMAELQDAIGAATVERSRLGERAALLSAVVADTEVLLEHARDGFASVVERTHDLQGSVARIELAASATATAAAAMAEAIDGGERFAKALAEAGFADEQSWLAAQLDPTEREHARGRLADYDEACVAVEHALAEAELNDPELRQAPPDLASLQATVTAIELDQAEAAQAIGSATATVDGSQRRARALEKIAQGAEQVIAGTAAAIRLGDLAAGLGENQLKMELTTYVLIRRFSEIVGAANGQLRRISGGRYELAHSDARQGNTKSGLGIRVLDLHTGRSRDPGTLSGGETFYVALALALGLADVVRAESGGVDLGTLFIDEGFGSLDPEVLDEVLAVLDTLRAGGRAVGVVSHVPEMKARIADRITIQPNPDGTSRVRVIA